MTMIPNILRADYYSIEIAKGENEMFTFVYKEGYDKNNKEHKKAFQNMRQIKDFHERSLSTYGKASVEFSREDMTISLSMTAPFEKLANFISMEFLMCGSLGKVTLLDFISMAATSIVSNISIDNKGIISDHSDCTNNKDMYV